MRSRYIFTTLILASSILGNSQSFLDKTAPKENDANGQARFFFNIQWPWIPLPWLTRPSPPVVATISCPVNSAATSACKCGTTALCPIGQYCTTTTSWSICSTLAPCGITGTTVTCSCGSATCSIGQTCTAATSICVPPICDVNTAGYGPCLCGTAICERSVREYCTASTSSCVPPIACLAGPTAVPCNCGSAGTAVCRIGQTCAGAGLTSACTG